MVDIINTPISIPSGVSNAPIAPQTPFIWGQGGARLSPDELARRQQVASAMMQSDFSPVGSVWEGLGRVANNVTGALDQRSLDREQLAINEDRNAQIAALLGEGNRDLTQGLTSSDPVVAALAGDIFKARQPKQIAPNEFERTLAGAGIDPNSPQGIALYDQRARTLAEGQPIVISDGMGGAQIIPRSSLGGGGTTQAPVGKLTPIDPSELGDIGSNAGGGFRP